jgi:DNA-binding NtrC family response regulator
MVSAPNMQIVRQASVLVVDDDQGVHRLLGALLKSSHYEVSSALTGAAALEAASNMEFDIILLDLGLPDESGIEVLRKFRAQSIPSGIVMISGDDEAHNVVEAMRLGALDYLVKPLHPDKVLATVTLAARAGRLERENRRLLRQLDALNGGVDIVGRSPVSRRLAGVLRRVAESDATVLIEGKAGSGKTMAAELIHKGSRRSRGPLVSAASDILTAESLEKALKEAERGTLVLEDIDLMSAPTQSRLVRHLKERSGQGDSPDVRVVATTSARLPELVARSKFREDLYYRLNVFPITVPSLQERREDIALLAMHFLKLSEEATGLPQKGFSASAMILLESHPWPGNVAQLQNAVMRAHTLAGGGTIDSGHLLGPSTGLELEHVEHMVPSAAAAADDEDVREEDILPLDTEEKRLLARALKATKGNVRRAAQLLRIGRATLYRKIQVYKLKLH